MFAWYRIVLLFTPIDYIVFNYTKPWIRTKHEHGERDQRSMIIFILL